jgi:transposase-like protein
MRLVEQKYKIDITTLLASQWLSLGQIAVMIDVDYTTISKWRKKLRESTNGG